MNLTKYRDTSDYREILRLFQKSSDQSGNLVWQNIDGQRKVFAVNHLEIDFVSREVVVYLEEPQKVDANYPLYFKLACNDTIFKHEAFMIQPDCLTFKFPKTLKTWELRSSERFALDENEEYTVLLSASAQGGTQRLKVRLLDFSATGLGLSISEMNKHLVRDTKVCWIHAINDHQFPEPVAGRVVHVSNESQGRQYRFGIQLQRGLPIEAVRSILH